MSAVPPADIMPPIVTNDRQKSSEAKLKSQYFLHNNHMLKAVALRLLG